MRKQIRLVLDKCQAFDNIIKQMYKQLEALHAKIEIFDITCKFEINTQSPNDLTQQARDWSADPTQPNHSLPQII